MMSQKSENFHGEFVSLKWTDFLVFYLIFIFVINDKSCLRIFQTSFFSEIDLRKNVGTDQIKGPIEYD